jgi:hypothetical protein
VKFVVERVVLGPVLLTVLQDHSTVGPVLLTILQDHSTVGPVLLAVLQDHSTVGPVLLTVLQDHSNDVGARGGIVVKALRYKPAGRRFDTIYVDQPHRAVVFQVL